MAGVSCPIVLELSEKPCLAEAERLGIFVRFKALDDAYTPIVRVWELGAICGQIDV